MSIVCIQDSLTHQRLRHFKQVVVGQNVIFHYINKAHNHYNISVMKLSSVKKFPL